ncbi:EamA family transporter RarD [Stagnihabitans tardus]|uniref:EamA family transporter RarD n=1 Tax=Stagnihabitans tardus TaxID=2699202 RepID=A0AAE4YA88_9RHOB|nr:EamA family transporter RarD [Stagnihabitans tardus]NBZ87593.1 EamA family transporter RarD [Stagnihabitans tardus]
MTSERVGVWAIVAACAIWGFAPLYYHAMPEVPALEMMAHRTIWTGVMFGAWVWIAGQGAALWALRAQAGRICLAALLIGFNWLLFIWAVSGGRAVEASLGYYIYPLVSAGLGALLFHERLARRQAWALALAAGAVLVLTLGLGVAPLVSLALAFSFAAYAAVKRGLGVPAMIGVLAEVLLIAPPLVLWLAWQEWQGAGWFGRDLYHTVLLPVAGPISGLPLVLFSYGAARVPMATSGLVQYLNPSLQFLSAWAIMGEAVSPWHGIALALIWGAIALYFSSRAQTSSSVST